MDVYSVEVAVSVLERAGDLTVALFCGGTLSIGLLWLFSKAITTDLGAALFLCCFAPLVGAVGILCSLGVATMRPMSASTCAAEAEKQAVPFLREYGGKEPSERALGEKFDVNVEVTRVDVKSRSFRVEAKDTRGRRWVFYTSREADRNPQKMDKLNLQFVLKVKTFGDGYVRPDEITWTD